MAHLLFYKPKNLNLHTQKYIMKFGRTNINIENMHALKRKHIDTLQNTITPVDGIDLKLVITSGKWQKNFGDIFVYHFCSQASYMWQNTSPEHSHNYIL